MTPIEWQTLNDIFHAARERRGDERRAFLAGACAGDDRLRERVERLLEAHDAAGGVLDQPVAERAFHLLAEPEPSAAGSMVGPYRLVREIGRGGMGAVYLAERADDQFTKQVAVKLIKRGMDTDAVLRHFRAERQILADLEHANIARLIDGGSTDDGLPYFVMEYVDGQPLDRYCNERCLGVDERLRLFRQVCMAVSYAHQRLVVHRDIKPSNILVGQDGSPKLLDFGIARIMLADSEAETLATSATFRPMTPEYASPEQVLGLRVDALSDVYSLGVLLYELLVGRPPYRLALRTPSEAAHLLTTTDPARPSAAIAGATGLADANERGPSILAVSAARGSTPERLRRRLQGDLDTIVLAALCVDRARRYQSVEQLAEDIRRHLHRLPIMARQRAVLYRVRKFVRRNRIAVGAASMVAATVLLGVVATLGEARRADLAERAAMVERDRAVAAERNATAERDRALRAEEVATGERVRAEQARNKAIEEARRADVQAAVARAVRDFLQNDLLGQASSVAQASQTGTADPDLTVRTALDRAAARISGRFRVEPEIEAAIRHTIGETYHELGLYAQAAPQLERALELRRRELGGRHRDTLRSLTRLGNVYQRQDQLAEAERLLTEAVAGWRALAGSDHPDTLAALADLATVAQRQGDRARAVGLNEEILRAQRRVLGEAHPDTLAVMNNLASLYVDQGQFDRGAAMLAEAAAVKRRVLGDEHPSTLVTVNGLGIVYRNLGRYAEAESLIQSVLDVRQRVLGPEHPDTLASRHSLARVYEAQGRHSLSEPLLVENLVIRRYVLGADHRDTQSSMTVLAESYRKQRKLAAAESLIQEVLEVRTRVLPVNHPNRLWSLTSLGALKLDQGQAAAAQTLLLSALDEHTRSRSSLWQRYYTESLLGAALSTLGRHDEAESLLLSGYAGLLERRSVIPVEERPLLAEVRGWIARFYESRGQPEKALAWRDTQVR